MGGVKSSSPAAPRPDPFVILPRKRKNMYKRIMLPIDGSELSDRAVNEGVALAKSMGAKVTVIHVISHYHVVIEEGFASSELRAIEKDHEDVSKKAAGKILDKAMKLAKAEGVDCDGAVVVGDQPHQEIIANAKKRQCDLIVMASHGRRGLEALVLGSETVKVLTHSKIPVLVVR